MQFAQGIAPDDQVEIRPRALALQAAHGIHGIRHAAPQQFILGNLEAGIALHGQPQHLQTVPGRGQREGGFVRRLGGGHPDHAVQAEMIQRILRQHQMPGMHRVKRAAQNADPFRHGCSIDRSGPQNAAERCPKFAARRDLAAGPGGIVKRLIILLLKWLR